MDLLIDLNFTLISNLAGLLGGSVGLAILVLAAGSRLMLLPLTLHVARRGIRRRRLLQRLKPELDRIEAEHGDDPRRRVAATFDLYRRHEYQPIDPWNILERLATAPILWGFLGAVRRGLGVGVRFLSVADLGRPSFLVALVVASLSYLGSLMHISPQENVLPALMMGAFFLVMVWQVVPAAMSLYFAGSSLVALGESILIKWEAGDPHQVALDRGEEAIDRT